MKQIHLILIDFAICIIQINIVYLVVCVFNDKNDISIFSIMARKIIILGHALREKGLQRQISVGTLVSSQERRALFVSLIYRGYTADEPAVNRWSTAGQPRGLGFVPPSVFPDILGMKRIYRDK